MAESHQKLDSASPANDCRVVLRIGGAAVQRLSSYGGKPWPKPHRPFWTATTQLAHAAPVVLQGAAAGPLFPPPCERLLAETSGAFVPLRVSRLMVGVGLGRCGRDGM